MPASPPPATKRASSNCVLIYSQMTRENTNRQQARTHLTTGPTAATYASTSHALTLAADVVRFHSKYTVAASCVGHFHRFGS